MGRREISFYKEIYKNAKDRQMHPMSIYRLVERAFGTAALGYRLHKSEDLKIDAKNFARTAEKMGKVLGKKIQEMWKSLYENFELQVSNGDIDEWFSFL